MNHRVFISSVETEKEARHEGNFSVQLWRRVSKQQSD
jgi:hypothetical protein